MNPVTHIIHLGEQAGISPFSGAENHLFILLRALVEQGVTTELLVLLQDNGPQIDSRLAELRQLGIATETIPYVPVRDRRATLLVRQHFLSRRHHIVHTHLDQADVTGKVGAFLAGCRRIISTTHNEEMHHLKLKWLATIHALDLITRRHIAISEAVKLHMVQRERLPGHKIEVIPYGVPLPQQTLDRGALRKQLGIPEDKFVIGFVGRLTEQKNIPLLLAAAKRLEQEMPDLLCVLVGAGELKQHLQAYVHEQHITNVAFLGSRPNAADLMPAFDALCLPSKWEGLGLVLVEAMQRRVLVIGSRVGAIPEVLANGQAGLLFQAGSEDDLVETIRKAYYDPELRHTITVQAYKHVVNTYTVEQMVRKTLSVYQALK